MITRIVRSASESPAFAPSTPPLVSVLLRSIDRPALDEALASVARQTGVHAEVVVVAARPCHRELPARCGDFPLRLVPTDAPLARSRAANRALESAQGEFLIFLDDDDWFMPGHLARLSQALQAQPRSPAAYSGVSLVNDAGEPLGQAMDLPFDGVRQLAGNLTPIHAVMFRRGLLAQGLRFDEQLEHYEDWDFWLQVARHGPMLHLPGTSAAYRIHESSGIHHDAQTGGLATARILEKWNASLAPAQRVRLMERAWATDDLRAELDAAQAAIADLKAAGGRQHETIAAHERNLAQLRSELERAHAAGTQREAMLAQQQAALQENAWQASRLLARNEELTGALAQRDAAVAHHEAHARALKQTLSWKLTAPLRWLARTLKRG
jgi:hypothetical protein